MSRSANVLSVQTLKDFKIAMINFAEDARNALSGVEMDLRRMRDWLERDQLGYWQMQVKRRNEDLMQARADLHRRKITQQGSDAVSDAEQKEALREAMRRLRIAEEKVALVKKLIPQLHHAIAEYHSHSQPLGDHLSGGFERSLGVLERMILSLEAYLATTAPSAPRIEPAADVLGRRHHDRRRRRTDRTADRRRPAARRRPTAGTATAAATATEPAPAPAGEAVLPGRTYHERPIRTAPARPEDPARTVGHRQGDLGRPRLPRLREEPHRPAGTDRQARDHRHGEALRDPRQDPGPV